MTRGTIARGAAWMVLARLLERSLGLISVLVLARLLVPADFGLVAMAMSVITLVELAAAFSFDLALIQRESPTRAHYDTAWTLNVAFGIGCAVVTAALARPSAWFYGEPRLTAVMLVLAIGWGIHGFENIGIVNFRRSMNFSQEFAFVLSKKAVAFSVTVTLAALLQNHWALIAGTLASRITGLTLSYVMEPFRPRFSLGAGRDLFSFSSWLLTNNVLNFLAGRLSHFTVGRLHGATGLGLYTVGSEIAFLPTTELVAPINRAVFPAYARIARDLAQLRQAFIDVVSLIMAVALPASLGIAAMAVPVVRLLLGDKWLPAAPVVQILALAGGISVLMSNTYSAYMALGRPAMLTVVKLGEIAVLIPAMFALSKVYGLEGIAYAEGAALGVTLFWSYPILFRTLELRIGLYAARVWRSVAAAIGMAVALDVFLGVLGDRWPALGPLPTVALAVPAGAVVYVVAIFALWLLSGRPHGAERLVLDRVKAMRGVIA